MFEARELPRNDYLKIKAACRDLVRAVGGVTRAAAITRLDAARISRACSPNDSSFLPIDVIADLEAHAEDPIVTRTLASLSGFTVIPDEATRPAGSPLQHLAAVAKEHADVVSSISNAYADGEFDADEISAAQDEVREAMEALANLNQALAEKARRKSGVVSIDRDRQTA
ncbi:hypothetical protein L1787_16720 [Acuticoccus sp. M5D2P5]|uniref:phage regulatory CII family protein n=1 Tax=Acuticoccus kalidii TaxID=2910977 RepID=UPI001F2C50CA|nr:phage regulatory CII family protein [Acuticoccus kalidii]MCF3935049.1 hypothetical protein [Acuticoccus kalidii]